MHQVYKAPSVEGTKCLRHNLQVPTEWLVGQTCGRFEPDACTYIRPLTFECWNCGHHVVDVPTPCSRLHTMKSTSLYTMQTASTGLLQTRAGTMHTVCVRRSYKKYDQFVLIQNRNHRRPVPVYRFLWSDSLYLWIHFCSSP